MIGFLCGSASLRENGLCFVSFGSATEVTWVVLGCRREARRAISRRGAEAPILEAVLVGESLRDAFERLLDVEDPARRGAVCFLSQGRIDRMELTIQAVRMALISYQSVNRF